jgi:hypothetical protein
MGWTFYNSSGQRLSSVADKSATQAEMEAASSTTVNATPGRTQYHPGVAKAWVHWEMVGTHSIKASYNVDSVTDGSSVGNTDHVWGTDFSSINYVVVGGGEWDQVPITQVSANKATTGMTTQQGDSNHAAIDGDNGMLAAFGDQ